MDLYTIWANKEGDISDLDWVNGMKSFFDHLISEGKMESYRITRCKMGFRSIADMPEFMILMEFKDMAQMDSAFRRVAPLEGELETKHKSFNQFVAGDIQHALFRDWPDQFQGVFELNNCMKTLREYIDQLDEISRRDFLKGAGATAGLAAIGDPKDAKADWNIIHHDDLLTNKRSVQGFSNSSVENPNVELVLNQWPSVGVVAALSPVPLPLGQRGEGKIGGIVVAYSPFRILIGNQLINDLKGAVFAETQGTGMILAVKNGLNSELIPIIANSLTNQETIKVEISQARKVFTFRGKKNFEEEVDEAATPDAVARIEELIKYK